MSEKVYLVLQNGEVFEGRGFGAAGDTVGELVFTTGMGGYIETLTDPNYYGQIVIQTFPLIGGYGMIEEDCKGKKPALSGYIVREYCETPSNFRCDCTLDEYMKKNNVIGLCDIDTRELTTLIREAGVMNAKITKDVDAISDILREIRMYSAEKAVTKYTCKSATKKGKGKTVVLLDLGNTHDIEQQLIKRGCEVITLPADSSCEEILKAHPAGVVLSDGPGDPQENRRIISEVARLTESGVPIFGISLGHEILALAMGGHTKKLKYGHRGLNQPVREVASGRVFVTAQNHGYAVSGKSLPKCASVSFSGVGDGSCEGVEYGGYKMFSVQFPPSFGSTMQDTTFLYDKFIALTEVK